MREGEGVRIIVDRIHYGRRDGFVDDGIVFNILSYENSKLLGSYSPKGVSL